MPAVACHIVGCDFVTPNVGDAAGGAMIAHHLATDHPIPAVGAGGAAAPAAPRQDRPKPKVDRPQISAGATSDDWSNFQRNWATFKALCSIPNDQLNKNLLECCEENLKHLMYGEYSEASADRATEAELLASIKRLAVVYESTLSHRLRLSGATQSPGQNIYGFLAVLKHLARPCGFSVTCSAGGCVQVNDYSDSAIKDQLIKGMADESDRQRLLAEPDCETMTLQQVATFLHRLETSHRPIQGAPSTASQRSVEKQTKCWCCGEANHPDNNNSKSREKHCKAFRVSCSKCSASGHYTRLCPKCTSCGEWGHRGKGFRGCPHHKKKPEKDGEKSETGGIPYQLCFIQSRAQLNCDSGQCLCSIAGGVHTPPTDAVPLPNHIFENGEWIRKNNPGHSMVSIRLSVNAEDHRYFRHPVSDANRLKTVTQAAVADTGCMAITVPPKVAYSLGLRRRDLIPCRVRMNGAGQTDLGTLGAFVANVSATTPQGQPVSTKQLAYVCEKVDKMYISKTAMQDLGMVSRTLAADPELASCTADTCDCPERGKSFPAIPKNLPDGLCGREEDIPKLKQWLLERYSPTAFNTCVHQPLPLMTGEPLRLFMAADSKPTAVHSAAPVPIHWQAKVKMDLDRDVRIGVLEKVPVNTPSTWCSRMVVTAKANGEPRRTVDMQPQNKYSVRQTFPIEPPFTLASRVPSNMKKTVVDAWNGYHSVPIHEDDKHITTFITPWGRYRYKVSPQGYLASGDGFNQRLDAILGDILAKVRCVDDTCLWAASIETAFFDTCRVLDTCARNGVILNPDKFQFCQDVVEFAGLQVTETGVKPSQKLLDAILNFPQPRDITGARGWFGLVEQAAWAFSRAEMMAPFRHLLRPRSVFSWTDELTTLFERSKLEIIRQIERGVRLFELNRPTCLASDFSGVGIGYFLLQKHCSCPGRTPICCKTGWLLTLVGSRFLHDAETRYAPVEGECLAVAYGLQQTKYFVLGCPDLTVATDHKPLLGLLNDRSLADIPNRRLLNLKEKTLDFRFRIVHVPGRLHMGPDAASRSPMGQPDLMWLPGEPDPQDTEIYGKMSTAELRDTILIGLMSSATDTIPDTEACVLATCVDAIRSVPVTSWEDIRTQTASDPSMMLLHDQILQGFPEDARTLPASLRPFAARSDSLYIADGVILSAGRIVVPPVLRPAILASLHAAHQGVPAMKARAQCSVWWPNITVDISRTRLECVACNKMAKSNPNLPPADPPQPDYPFQMVCSDYYHTHGKDYVVLVDRYTNWPIVFESRHGAEGLVQELRLVFATFGAPEEITTDGGTPYTAAVTQSFLKDWGVRHRLATVANPHANARAEIAVKQVKRIMAENVSNTGALNVDAFQKSMLTYRNTPDPTTGVSPAMMLFGRQVRDMIPAVLGNYVPNRTWTELLDHREKALRKRETAGHERWEEHSRRLPALKVGDTVFVQNQTGNHPRRFDRTGVVVEVRQNDAYMVKLDGSGRTSLRNRKFLRQFVPFIRPAQKTSENPDVPIYPGPQTIVNSPVRPTTPPARLHPPAELSQPAELSPPARLSPPGGLSPPAGLSPPGHLSTAQWAATPAWTPPPVPGRTPTPQPVTPESPVLHGFATPLPRRRLSFREEDVGQQRDDHPAYVVNPQPAPASPLPAVPDPAGVRTRAGRAVRPPARYADYVEPVQSSWMSRFPAYDGDYMFPYTYAPMYY